MNLHNLLNSTTEFEHIKAQYFTVFAMSPSFLGDYVTEDDNLRKSKSIDGYL
jgi:hypothetical protein